MARSTVASNICNIILIQLVFRVNTRKLCIFSFFTVSTKRGHRCRYCLCLPPAWEAENALSKCMAWAIYVLKR